MSSSDFLSKDEQDESNIKKKGLSDLKSINFLLEYAKPRKWKFIAALFLMLFCSFFAIFSSRSMGHLVEDGLMPKNFDSSTYWAIAIVTLEIFGLGFQWLGRKILIKNASFTILDIRKSLFSFIHKLPLGFYDRQPQGRVA